MLKIPAPAYYSSSSIKADKGMCNPTYGMSFSSAKELITHSPGPIGPEALYLLRRPWPSLTLSLWLKVPQRP